jgi:hypothetical protein
MLIEAALSSRLFVTPFYYSSGSGSPKAKSYGSYGSGSATLAKSSPNGLEIYF